MLPRNKRGSEKNKNEINSNFGVWKWGLAIKKGDDETSEAVQMMYVQPLKRLVI